MPPSRNDILGQNPDKRTKIILIHAAHPEGLAVVDLVHELGLDPKKRSGLVDNHLEPLVKAGVLEDHSTVPIHGKQKRKTEKNGYRLKDGISTLKTLVSGDELCHEIMKSLYYRKMIDLSCEHFSFNLDAAGMPELTGDEKTCLKIVLKHSISCLRFVLGKTPSELKAMEKEIEDRNKQQKKIIKSLVLGIIDDPGTAGKPLQWVKQMMSESTPHRRIPKSDRQQLAELVAIVVESLVIAPLSWELFFYEMMKLDGVVYGAQWSPEDENAVIRLVINSFGCSMSQAA